MKKLALSAALFAATTTFAVHAQPLASEPVPPGTTSPAAQNPGQAPVPADIQPMPGTTAPGMGTQTPGAGTGTPGAGTPMPGAGAATPAPGVGSPAMPGGPGGPASMGAVPDGFVLADETMRTADNLNGARVYDGDDSRVGKVSDLLLEGDRVSHVVVDVGGFLGIGSHTVALPIEQVEVFWNADAKESMVRVGMTKDQLRDLPEHKG